MPANPTPGAWSILTNADSQTEPCTPEMLKRMKVESDAPSTSGSAKPQSRPVTIRDEEEEEAEERFAPGGDADYYIEEDDEGGRFFGGGLTDEQKKILNIFDRAGGEGAQDEDVGELCRSCFCCFAARPCF